MAAPSQIPNLAPFILIRGAGEMASAVAWRLYMANLSRICMLELANPLSVRRRVAFSSALETGSYIVEGVEARTAAGIEDIEAAWRDQKIAVTLTADWQAISGLSPDVFVDATLAKRNLGTAIDLAPLVIALGPGFEAGKNCHLVIETNRGHDLGRIIESGGAEPNTGIPGGIDGFTAERVLRAPAAGIFETDLDIGARVGKGDVIGRIGGQPVTAALDGVLRGLIRAGTEVREGLKLGDIDPRGKLEYCNTISDKARAISGSVLEAVMRFYNQPGRHGHPD
ncbi:MAG: selenium-dependent molybdenum cofactor biosynthesis protein YqeB [Rhodospirillales bacterium]|jgi:xanthine dehydrogenase accessory factor|nr:molybdenum hydroxylase [Rhodospirillaceae bacterium]MDP6426634.1 selenium-dependent molybdenum cofactor biosynthesis protein YqeB [Rhodospirillales bacterium]MDP6644680.1 selenium-dependent molybdenum cofactor biosynthesis protein YqeB [Rhodospirillales bacterium]MDP6842535.1 selenium-dependent molybdenum cofactor biosynthesis protein YqeB [Rhodospirillales bacterium]